MVVVVGKKAPPFFVAEGQHKHFYCLYYYGASFGYHIHFRYLFATFYNYPPNEIPDMLFTFRAFLFFKYYIKF